MNLATPSTFTPFEQDNLSWVLDIYMDAKNEYNACTTEENRTLQGFMQWTNTNVLANVQHDVAIEIAFNFAFILTSPEFIELTPEEIEDLEKEIYGDEDETTSTGK